MLESVDLLALSTNEVHLDLPFQALREVKHLVVQSTEQTLVVVLGQLSLDDILDVSRLPALILAWG